MKAVSSIFPKIFPKLSFISFFVIRKWEKMALFAVKKIVFIKTKNKKTVFTPLNWGPVNIFRQRKINLFKN